MPGQRCVGTFLTVRNTHASGPVDFNQPKRCAFEGKYTIVLTMSIQEIGHDELYTKKRARGWFEAQKVEKGVYSRTSGRLKKTSYRKKSLAGEIDSAETDFHSSICDHTGKSSRV